LAADADEIAAAVDLCPSGALSYTRPLQEERVSEQPTPAEQPVTVITVTANGPNLLAGNLEIRNEAGELVKTAKRLALCRCGGSSTKPFCDGTHKQIGFTDPGPSAG
jgi:CDGSH-type Zn-finger protein